MVAKKSVSRLQVGAASRRPAPSPTQHRNVQEVYDAKRYSAPQKSMARGCQFPESGARMHA